MFRTTEANATKKCLQSGSENSAYGSACRKRPQRGDLSSGRIRHTDQMRIEAFHSTVCQVLDIDHLVMRALEGACYLVELQVQRTGVSILCVLAMEGRGWSCVPSTVVVGSNCIAIAVLECS